MRLTRKSRFVSLLLTVFLGPVGLLYSSVSAAVIIAILMFFTLPTVVLPVALWFCCIVIGDVATHKHNRSVDIFMSM